MIESAASVPPKIVLQNATLEQEPVLSNLLQLYIHDFSEFYPVDIGTDGRFRYPNQSLYWSEAGRYPFLILIDDRPGGLAFVHRTSYADREVFDMAEFFVIRSHRRLGCGMRIAHNLWRRFPGAWQVRVMQSNIAALAFWARTISAFINMPTFPSLIERDGIIWNLFSFESPHDG